MVWPASKSMTLGIYLKLPVVFSDVAENRLFLFSHPVYVSNALKALELGEPEPLELELW
jgi:hypothetical protein